MGKHKKDKKEKKKKRKLAKAVAEAKRKMKLEKAAAKARIKATETPEERDARRVANKKRKEAKREEDKSIFGYTNESNPFRDPNLTKAFVWKKKVERDGRSLSKASTREKQLELKREIENVKARREQRLIEQQQMEEMKAQMQRDADAEANAGWEEKEEQFHAHQAARRSVIRIREGRERPIDVLAKNVLLYEEKKIASTTPVSLDVELQEPYTVFEGLEMADLRPLQEEIQVHISMGKHLRYWNALLVLCNDSIAQLGHGVGSHSGIHSSVREDVLAMFDDVQSEKELDAISREVQRKISKGGRGVDIPYWEAVSRQLVVFTARAYLKNFHEELLKKRLSQLKESYFQEETAKEAEDADSDSGLDLIPRSQEHGEIMLSSSSSSSSMAIEVLSDSDFSAELLMADDEDDSIPVVDPEYDRKNLEVERRIILEQKDLEEQAAVMDAVRKREADKNAPEQVLKAAGLSRFMSSEEMYAKEASKPLGGDEGKFQQEIDVEPLQPYWWHDKYRPRKPRYFNRVKTGYDWNRYNQTHYDKENPPPKIVQGYKFNIFFPDLIDPTQPPKYVRERIPGEDDYELMRFVAGPPYEDIAFKIVRREWELSHRRGYKNTFDRGVLHLYFNFRRYFYRR